MSSTAIMRRNENSRNSGARAVKHRANRRVRIRDGRPVADLANKAIMIRERAQPFASRSTLWAPSIGAWPDNDGVRFGVWAPESHHVDVVYERLAAHTTRRLERDEQGIFRGWIPAIEMGTRYRFFVDG